MNLKNKPMKKFLFFIWIGILTFQISLAQKLPKDLDADLVEKWYGLHLDLIPKTEGMVPPVVARAIAYTGLGLYEALVPGMSEYQSLNNKLQEFKGPSGPKNPAYLNYPYVANEVLFQLSLQFYADKSKNNQEIISEFYQNQKNQLAKSLTHSQLKASQTWAQEVAENIIKYAKKDGGHEAVLFPKDYAAPAQACSWVPVGKQQALLPYWGKNRTFISGASEHNLPAPPKCEIGNSSLLYVQALEVYSINKNLDDEQKAIAEFWADDAGKTFTPPGHGVSIALQIMQKERLSLEKAAELLCRLGIASSDAFVSCWNCKYQYFLLRPTSFIQSAIDPNFKSYLATPPFPEYTSGHGTVSGAISAVLSDIFGYNYAFTDHSHNARGLKPRSFNSFEDFAREAALSRLYGGIHYRMSNDRGLENGKKIGRKACELKLKMKGSEG
jgi:hypothetical protein